MHLGVNLSKTPQPAPQVTFDADFSLIFFTVPKRMENAREIEIIKAQGGGGVLKFVPHT